MGMFGADGMWDLGAAHGLALALAAGVAAWLTGVARIAGLLGTAKIVSRDQHS